MIFVASSVSWGWHRFSLQASVSRGPDRDIGLFPAVENVIADLFFRRMDGCDVAPRLKSCGKVTHQDVISDSFFSFLLRFSVFVLFVAS